MAVLVEKKSAEKDSECEAWEQMHVENCCVPSVAGCLAEMTIALASK